MKMSKLILVTVMIVSTLFSEERMVVRFSDPDKSVIMEFSPEKYDVAAYKPGEYLDIVVSKSEYEDILEQGFDVRITQTESQLKQNLGNVRDLYGYRNYEELVSELQQIEAQYPNICRLYDLGDSWGKEYSVNGNSYYDNYFHEIWALKVSDNVDIEEDEPAVYYMGVHHAREPLGVEVVMSNLYHILDNYGTDPTITQNVNNTQIWFVPLVNPNGHKIVTELIDIWWRKNIRDNNGNGQFNTDDYYGYGVDGVDPNRNYGFEWGSVGTSEDWASPVYHGPEEWSEPEIFAMKELMESHHFVTGITYHSYSELVLFPFGYQYGAVAPDHAALEELAIDMAMTIPSEYGGYYTPQQSLELYPAMGTTDDYSYGVHGTFSYTIELGTEFIPPASQIDFITEGNIEAAMILLDRVNHATLTGHITDAISGEPIVGKIFIDGIDNTGSFKYPYQSDEAFGRYYRLLQAGTYDVTFSGYGYLPVTVENVSIDINDQTVLDIALEPATTVTVFGTITDALTGDPIVNATVELPGTPIDPVITDLNGQYTIPDIFEDTYIFRVFAFGYAPVVEQVTISETNSTADFQLYQSSYVSFENGEFGLGWEFTGDADWVIDNSIAFDGVYSAKSGNISDDQSSTLSITLDINAGGEISFYRKVSSESGYDFLMFYIDGQLKDFWSGDIDWGSVSYPVSQGIHTFRWVYEKDTYVSSGADCGWIDYIEFPPVDYPDIDLDPVFINVTAETGNSVTEYFTIGNSGGSGLSYIINTILPPEEDWLSVNPTSGMVLPEETHQIEVLCNATGLTDGSYNGNINISSNDPDELIVTIPVEFTVGPALPQLITVEIQIQNNWNMVGLPTSVDDANVTTLFPSAIGQTLYLFDGQYNQVEELVSGTGYWLRFNDGGINSITGYEISEQIVSLSEGWNLFSGISTPVNVSSIIDPEGLIVPGTVYGFEAGYTNFETIEPGYGYWLRSNGNGNITISDTGPTRYTNFTNRMAEANTISFNGNKLFFGVKVPIAEKLSYSLPPKPPKEAFDVRFIGDWKYTEESGEIDVMNITEKLTVSYNIVMEAGKNMKWILMNAVSGQENILERTGEFEVSGDVKRFVLKKEAILPEKYVLFQNYPNPFNPITTVRYNLPEQTLVTISIYDLKGRLIKQLLNAVQEAGFRSVKWDATNEQGRTVGAGVYLYRIKTGDPALRSGNSFIQTKKMVLLR